MLRTLLIALALVLFAGLAAAQDPAEPIDYDRFATVAERAESAVDNPESPTAFLESLREDLADWRTRLLEAETANSARIETLQSQLEALGPAPDAGAGEAESAEIAQRREELNDLLRAARAPGVQATEAYTRANGLVSEIDTIVRTRQNEAVLESGPSPVNPANWAAALSAVTELAGNVIGETRLALSAEWRQAALISGLPLTLGLLAIAIILLARGRHWMAQLTRLIQARRRRRGRITLGFLVSLGQIVVPVAGMSLLVSALVTTDIIGPKGEVLLYGLLRVAVACYCAVWLVGRLYPAHDDYATLIMVDDDLRTQARRRGLSIGLLVGAAILLRELSDLREITPAVEAVLALPIFVGLSLGYLALARTLRVATQRIAEEETLAFSQRLLGYAGRVLSLVAIAGPLIAAAGYHNFADALMMPTAMTLGVLGLLIALQPPIRDLYSWITRTDIDEAQNALIPVLLNFALVLASVPLLLLIWGMRVAELNEIYTRFSEGITLGDARITPGDILAVILVFAIGLTVTRLIQGALKSTVLPRTKMDVGAQNAITSVAGYVGIALAALLAVNMGGIDLTALAVVFGALSVGIGFGLQNVVQNFVSGIILLIERPIGEGDWIEVGGQMGIVKDISVRSTTIETFDKQQVIVPNADFISGTVTNWTRGNSIGRAVITVGVAYGTDTRKVAEILMEIIKESPHVAVYPEPGIDFLGFGADSLDFRIRAILNDVNQLLTVKNEAHHRIAERFTEEGIEIPFAQRDIWLRNPEALSSASAGADGAAARAEGDARKPDATPEGQSGLEGMQDQDGEDGGTDR